MTFFAAPKTKKIEANWTSQDLNPAREDDLFAGAGFFLALTKLSRLIGEKVDLSPIVLIYQMSLRHLHP